jgi:hypothetical protein
MARTGSKAQPLIITDPEHFGDKDFIAKEEWFQEKHIPQADGSVKVVLPKPNFSVSEVAKVFFAEDPDWLRWRLKKSKENPHGFFVLDGQPIPERRTQNGTEHGFRYYTLVEVERMAHALAQNGAISGQRLTYIVTIIKNMLKLYGHIG